MKKSQLLGIIRHALTFIGGIFVIKGYLDESLANEIIGGLSTLIGTVWSIFDKKEEVTNE